MTTPEAEPQRQPYAICVEDGCGLEMADRNAMLQHLEATRPTVVVDSTDLLAKGVVTTSHRAQVVNPTPEERQEQRVRQAIASALDSFYAELGRDVDLNRFTVGEVTEQLIWFDLGDGWEEFMDEDGEG